MAKKSINAFKVVHKKQPITFGINAKGAIIRLKKGP
jgi:hypothetical protein